MQPRVTWFLLIAGTIFTNRVCTSEGVSNQTADTTTNANNIRSTEQHVNSTSTPPTSPTPAQDPTSSVQAQNTTTLPAETQTSTNSTRRRSQGTSNKNSTSPYISEFDSISVKVLIAEGEALSVHDMRAFKRQPRWVDSNTTRDFYSVDFHWGKMLVFFSADDKIFRGHIQGKSTVSEIKTIVDSEVEGAVSLAVDWVHDKLYWMSEKFQKVEMADLDGENRTLLWDNLETFAYPNNIAVDPHAGYLFLVSNYVVLRSGLQGEMMKKVNIQDNEVGEPFRGVRCLALDRSNEMLYITGKGIMIEDENANRTSIYIDRVGYDGGDPKPLLEVDKKWNDVFAMDVLGDILYFAHYKSINNSGKPDTLWSAPLNNKDEDFIFNATERWVPQHGRSGIWGIRAFHPCAQRKCN